MSSINEIAKKFFDACETGKGWSGCKDYCLADASFSSQAGPIADITTVEAYSEWMKGLLTFIPNGSYEIKSFAADEERGSINVYAIFSGTHSAEGGPLPPTGKSVRSDYVYVMEFDGDKVSHMTKIWNAHWAMEELGWV